MNPVLTIDPEFEAKCPPLTEDELSQLEENILEEGLVLMPLIVWNDTIVDGHNRYRMAQAFRATIISAPDSRMHLRDAVAVVTVYNRIVPDDEGHEHQPFL